MRRSDASYDEVTYNRVAKQEFFKRIITVYMCVVLTVVAGVGIVSFVRDSQTVDAIRDTQLEGTPLGKRLNGLAITIEDCVNPEGQCFKDGEERTGEVISQVSEITAMTIACADEVGTQTYKVIRACVLDRLNIKEQ